MRVTCAVSSRKRRKRVLERAKGFYGASSKQIRTVYDAVDKAGVHAYKGRKQKKNLKAQKKNNAAQKVKEVKFHVTIDKHDYEFKIKKALDFLEKGCRLKITLALRGREMAHQDIAFDLMNNVMTDLAPYGEADGSPKLLGRNISVTFAPK